MREKKRDREQGKEREREREHTEGLYVAYKTIRNMTTCSAAKRGLKLACGGRGGSVGPPGSVDAREIQNPYIKTQPSQPATTRLIQNNIMGAAT